MSLFGALVRTAVNVVTLPVAVVADVVTLGGDSVDGGKTVLADYATSSDYGDWASNSLTTTDPYDAYVASGSNALTTVDLAVLDSIGYTTV